MGSKVPGLHCAGRGCILEMGNKSLKLPCKGQEWGQALPMREDEEVGLGGLGPCCIDPVPARENLATQQQASFTVDS